MINLGTEDRFEQTPVTTTFDEHGPTRDGRRYLPISGMPMYGLLLFELCPSHAVRFPLRALPDTAPRWQDAEGEPLSILTNDPEVLQAYNDSWRSDLTAASITTEPSHEDLWCIQRLDHGTYTQRFSEELNRHRGAQPRPATDRTIITALARTLFDNHTPIS